jgi:TP901 family phage tail tape measure protein
MAIDIPIISKFNDKGVKDATQQLSDFGKQAGMIAVGAAAAVSAIGIASVKAFADFDAAMNESLAIMGNVSDALREDMAQTARDVAKSTTFSAEEAAEAFYFLASAGLTAEQSIGAMPKVAAFAQAGMFDLATATSLLADAQSAMGLTSSDATENMENLVRVSDVLVKANILANASVQQFSEALTNKAAASMKALNIPLEQGVAVLAAFAAQGIKGSEAGTTFNATIRGLTNGVLRFGDRFKAMNIEVYDAQGNFNNMADIMGQMEDAIGGLSVEQQRAALTQLGFTEETLAGTLALLGNSDAIRSYEESLREAGGTTDEVAGKQLQTLNAQMDLLRSRVQDAGIEIGQRLEPAIVAMAEQMGPVIDELVPVFVQLFEQLLPVIMQLAEAMPQFLEGLAPLIPIIGDLAELVFAVALAAMPALQEIIETLQPILEAFTGVMAEHGEVVGGLIVAIGLMVVVVRIATAAMGFYAAATGTATATSSTFFGVLTKNPVAAFAILILGGSVAMYTFRDSIRETGTAGEVFMEAWARVTFGIQWFTKNMVNGAMEALELLHTGVRKVIEAVTNDVRKLGGLPPITLPALKLPRIDVTPLDEYRRDLGLLEKETMKFTPKNVSGGPGSFPIGSEDRRFGGVGTGSLNFPETSGMRTGTTVASFQDILLGVGGSGGLTGAPLASAGATRENTFNINVNAGLGVNGQRVGDDILSVIQQYEREVGPVFERVRYAG